MAAVPTVSVIIPSYRRLERLPALIESYLAQGADEVVVVLDGPHRDWQAVLSGAAGDARVQVIELPLNRGLALARIAGLDVARGEVILVTDDDVLPGDGLVSRHREFHGEHRNHVLMGYMPVDLPSSRGPDEAATRLYARDYEKQVANWLNANSHSLLGSLWGGNVSLSRELYLRAEHYRSSQRLNYNEDLDLGIRLDRVGAVATFDPGALASHQHRRDFGGFVVECVVRGEAVADLEKRWGFLPGQLVPLVRIPGDYRQTAAWLQRLIGARDDAGAVEYAFRFAYRSAGAVHAWAAQDAIARLLRRGLTMRGYRLRSLQHAATNAIAR
ncbi:MAG: glycosyltransferase family 2 protein [Microbacteriaceae bacterium]